MAKHSLAVVMQHLRTVAAVQTCRDVPDPDLLERFVAARDEAAFTVLMERHGPMVLGVCRRALPNFHDAEDACQATFLVLARKASAVRKKTSLGSWLHGAAGRAAARLKRDHARRQHHERVVAAPAPKDPAAEVSWREVQAALDEELGHLPERYRAPLILCYLEGLTRDEAAQQLGLSAGSLHGRLERGRALLRERLIRRGLTLAAEIAAAGLGGNLARAALEPTFVVSSTKAALLLAAGQPCTEGLVEVPVLTLTQEVLKTMFLTKVKLGTAAVLCAGLSAALIGSSLTSHGIAQDARPGGATENSSHRIPVATTESDKDFAHRLSRDLRGTEPTPAEVHFFVASKDAGKRQKLIDLFIQERQAKRQAQAEEPLAGQNEAAGADDLIKAVELRAKIEKERKEFLAQQARKDQEKLAPPPPTESEINGRIEKIDPKDPALVSISVGSDAGLATNHVLEVYRLKPAPFYLGRIRVIAVTPQKAVARRVGTLPVATPEVGDQVTSRLTALPNKKKE